jgi:hypothetical protein
MADRFQRARLIPVSGISNNIEAEMRATSALLSVLTIVRDLSLALTSPLGASAAKKASVESFIETRFKLADGAVVRPDGLVQVSYGSSTWRALVEVKTGHDLLAPDQVNNYLSVAREQGIDAVITISNEIAVGERHPCEGVRQRANSKVRLAHCSWTEILAQAVRTKVHRGVDDPEQAWVLGELIRYLEHPASGALAFDDMGATWVAGRDAAREGTLLKSSMEARDIAQRWDQLIRFAALRLGSDTGADVHAVVPKAQTEPRARLGHLTDNLTTHGLLDATIRVPGAAGNIEVAADLRARQVIVSTTVNAPIDRGSRARVSWLVRQLDRDTAGDLLVEAWPRNARQPITATLAGAAEDRDALLDPDKREILRFRLVRRGEMGRNRKDGGRSPGFVESVTRLVEAFYASVLQEIVPWTAKPPQARSSAHVPDIAERPVDDSEELDEVIADALARDGGQGRDGLAPEVATAG